MIGEIKFANKIGYKGKGKFIKSPCEVCGKERWVQLMHGKPRYKKCLRCSIIITHLKHNCPLNQPGNLTPKERADICLGCKRERCRYESKKRVK